MGTAQMVEGKLTCIECIRATARAERAKTSNTAPLPVGKILIASLVILGVAGVLLPGQVLLIVAGGSLLAIAAAAFGFTLSSTVRLLIGFMGLLALGGSFYGMSALQEQTERSRAAAEINKDVAEVRELLAADRFADAQNRLRTLSAAASKPGATETLKSTVKTLESEQDQWLEKNFGAMDLQTRGALTRLLAAQAFKNASGSRRIRSFSIDEKTAKLALALDCRTDNVEKAPNGAVLPADKDSLLEAVNMGAALFQHSATLQTVEVQVINAAGDAPLGTFKLDSSDAAIFGGAPRIEDAMRLFKAGS